MLTVTRAEIVGALRNLGLEAGQILWVHSSLRAIGQVEGGADAVVDAMLEVLGPRGTLVVPTFTPSKNRQAEPIFDPGRDPSEVGMITEVARTRPGAVRSVHLLHSVAALGRLAREIAGQQGPCVFAADGPFWRLYDWDARILLLGVPYLRCIYVHIPEILVISKYRYLRDVEARWRDADGTLRPLETRVWSPKSDCPPDLNKVGAAMEARGLVRVGPVGNAVARLTRARDMVEVGIEEYRKDPRCFIKTADDYASLADGVLAEELFNEKSVYDPALIRPHSSPFDRLSECHA